MPEKDSVVNPKNKSIVVNPDAYNIGKTNLPKNNQPSVKTQSNLNLNEYKDYIDPNVYNPIKHDYDELRANNQSAGEQALYIGKNALATFGTATLQDLAVVGSLAGAALTPSSYEGDFMDNWLNNNVVRGVDNLKDYFLKNGEVYLTKEQQEDTGLLDYLSSGAKFWDDLGQGLGFMASQIIPTGLVAKPFAMASKGAKGIKEAGIFSKWLEEATLAKHGLSKLDDVAKAKLVEQGVDLVEFQNKLGATQKLLDKTGVITGSLIGRMGESAMESNQTYQELIKAGVPEEEARQQANNVFGFNMALAIPDAFQYINTFGKVNKLLTGVDSFTDNSIKKAAQKLIIKGSDDLYRVNKLSRVNKLGNYIWGVAKTAAIEQEEEGLQNTFQEAAKLMALDNVPSSKVDNYFNAVLNKYSDSWTTTEGQKARLLGAILGGGATAITTTNEQSQIEKTANEIVGSEAPTENQADQLKLNQQVLQKEKLDPTKLYITKEDGTTVLNNQYLRTLNNYTFLEGLKQDALKNNNTVDYNRLSDLQLLNQTIAFSQAGKIDELIDKYQMLGEASETEMQTFFGESAVDSQGNELTPKQIATKTIEKIKKFGEIYDSLNTDPTLNILSNDNKRLIAYKLSNFEINNNELSNNINPRLADLEAENIKNAGNYIDSTIFNKKDLEDLLEKKEDFKEYKGLSPLKHEELLQLKEKKEELSKENENILTWYDAFRNSLSNTAKALPNKAEQTNNYQVAKNEVKAETQVSQEIQQKAELSLQEKIDDIEKRRQEELTTNEAAWRNNVDEKDYPKESLQPLEKAINDKYDEELKKLQIINEESKSTNSDSRFNPETEEITSEVTKPFESDKKDIKLAFNTTTVSYLKRNGNTSNIESQQRFNTYVSETNVSTNDNQLQVITYNHPIYGYNKEQSLFNEDTLSEDEVKQNIKVLVVDKTGNPIEYKGEKVYTSLFKATNKFPEGGDESRFSGTEDEDFTKSIIDEYQEWRDNILSNYSDKNIYLEIVGQSKGKPIKNKLSGKTLFESVIGRIRLEDGTLVSEKNLNKVKLNVVKGDTPFISITLPDGRDVKIKNGTPYVNHNGIFLPLISRKLISDEVINAVNLIRQYYRVLGTKDENKIYDDKGNILKNIRTILQEFLYLRKDGSPKQVWFNKEDNTLQLGTEKFTQEDIISGKFDSEIFSFLSEKYHQIQTDNNLLDNNKKYIKIFVGEDGIGIVRNYSNYTEYLLSGESPALTTYLQLDNTDTNEINAPQFANGYLIFSRDIKENIPVKTKELQSSKLEIDNNIFKIDSFSYEEASKLQVGSIITFQNNLGTFDIKVENGKFLIDNIIENKTSLSNDKVKNVVNNFINSKDKSKRDSISFTQQTSKESTIVVNPETRKEFIAGKELDDIFKENIASPEELFRLRTVDRLKEKPIDLEYEREWFKRNIPDSISFEQFTGLIKGHALGSVQSGGKVLISNLATEGTVYHEAFHVVSNFLLTKDETQKLYNEYRTRTNQPNLSNLKVEEQLAEEFRNYVLLDGKYNLSKEENNVFKKLYNFLKRLLGINSNEIEKLFKNINKGEFKNSEVLTIKLNNTLFQKNSFGNDISKSNVEYTLKAVDILQSDKAIQIFEKGKKSNWDLNKILTELQIPKEQKQLLLDLKSNDREELLISLLANYSYSIETNISSTKNLNNVLDTLPEGEYIIEGVKYSFVADKDGIYIYRKDNKIIKQNEFDEAVSKLNLSISTSYYSDLTVPGGTNYRENEISIPNIEPSVKGHAQFSTDNGIGWFRSDEKNNNNKTRRILEVQSDLFQKSRDKDNLAKDYSKGLSESKINDIIEILQGRLERKELTQQEYDKEIKELKGSKKENNFLQLLNKDNNWVTFFIKSIIQDSAKRGYEKVLFPSGNTAAKIEGHQTLEEFKVMKEKRLGYLLEELEGHTQSFKSEPNSTVLKKLIVGTEREIKQIQSELERAETDFSSLNAIAGFYENQIKNILKKNYKVNEVTDEDNNTWNEIEIEPENLNNFLFRTDIDLSDPSIQKEVVLALNTFFFDRIFKDENLSKLFTTNSKLPASQIYKQVQERFKELTEKLGDRVPTFIKLASTNDSLFNAAATKHLDYLEKTLGVKFTGDDSIDTSEDQYYEEKETENDRVRDVLGIDLAMESSTKDGLPRNIKLLIIGLKDYDKDGKLIKGEQLGLPQAADFNNTLNHLQSELANLNDYPRMIEKLTKLASKTPNSIYKELLSNLKSDTEITPINLSLDQIFLQNSFVKQFAQTKNEFKLIYINDEGNSYFVDSNSQKQFDKIKEKWRNNIWKKNNKIVNNVNGKLIVDGKKLEELPIKTVEDKLDFFKAIGVEFTGKNIDWTGFNELRNQLIKNQAISDLFDKNQVDASGRWNHFILQEIKNTTDAVELQHINVDGKTVYGITLNTYLSNLTIELNLGNIPDYLKSEFNPYVVNSILLERIKEGKKINLEIIEGLKEENEQEGIHISKSKTGERLLQSFTSIMNNKYQYLRASDKKTEFAFSLDIPFIYYGKDISMKNMFDSTVEIFSRYIQDELNLINQNIDNKNYKNYRNNANQFVIFKDILSNDTKQNIIDKGVEANKDKINLEIENYLYQQTRDNIRLLKEYKLIIEGGYNRNNYKLPTEIITRVIGKKQVLTDEDVEKLISAMTVNSLIANIEQTKLYTGSPAFYKNSIEFFKRTSALTGTKIYSRNDANLDNWLNSNFKRTDGKIANGKINTIVFNDVKGVNEELKKAGYEGYEETDAQGIITLDEQREFLLRQAGWNNTLEAEYQNEVKFNDKLPHDPQGLFMNLKPQYFGNQDNVTGFVPTFYKFSTYCLYPSLINQKDEEGNLKFPKLYDLYWNMNANQIGIGIFASGNKMGRKVDNRGRGQEFYNKEGEIADINEDFVQVIDYKYLGIQVDNKPIKKYSVTSATQVRSIVQSNLFDKGESETIKVLENGKLINKDTSKWSTEYDDTISKLTSLEREKLLKDLGLVDNGDNNYKFNGNYKKLKDILEKEFKKRDVSLNMMNGLDLILSSKNDNQYFDLLVNKQKIENILFSLINNNIIKQKVFGDMMVQTSSAGFELTTRKQSEDSWAKSQDALKFYRKGEHGEILAAECYVPHYFTEFIGKSVNIQELKKTQPDLFQVIAFRIPTEQLNSIDVLEIKDFLPYESGNMIVLPSEIVKKTGSDMDYDKLTIYIPEFNLDENDNPIYAKGDDREGLQNRLIELMKQVILSPDNFNSLILPNSISDLTEIKNDLSKYTGIGKEDESFTKIIEWGYINNIAEQYWKGKDLVGVFALHNKNHILCQQIDLQLNPKLVKFNFKELKNNDKLSLGRKYVIDESGKDTKKLISIANAQLVSASVDVTADPSILTGLNINNQTANIISLLIRLGLSQEKVFYFINQPIIREYLKDLSINQGVYLKSNEVEYKRDIIKRLTINYKQEDVPLTLNILKKEIATNSSQSNLQKQILLDFIHYKEIADQLANLQKAVSMDTHGVGKDRNTTKILIQNYNDSIQNGLFINQNRFATSTYLKEFINIVLNNSNIYNELFFVERPEVQEELNTIFNTFYNLENNGDNLIKILNIAENDMINYLLQNINYNNELVKNETNRLFKGEESIPKRLARYIEAFPSSLLANEFFPLLNRDSGIDNLKLFSKRLNYWESNNLTIALKELFTTDNNLAQDFIKFAMLQSGLNRSPISFVEIIPNEYYLNTMNNIINSFKQGDYDLSEFYDIFFQNNWNNNLIVPYVYSKTINNTITIFNRNKNYPYIKTIVKDSLGKKNTYLYKKFNEEGNFAIFKIIDKKGDGIYLKELNNNESILNSNKVNLLENIEKTITVKPVVENELPDVGENKLECYNR